MRMISKSRFAASSYCLQNGISMSSAFLLCKRFSTLKQFGYLFLYWDDVNTTGYVRLQSPSFLIIAYLANAPSGPRVRHIRYGHSRPWSSCGLVALLFLLSVHKLQEDFRNFEPWSSDEDDTRANNSLS
ncbi:hypothetical protein TNCV_2754931 [Trichonephila clavipes]|nr:hypothetical protein TNCV_2754931 [Trichonephila clavipes]